MKKFTAKELSQILKVSVGTFRNQYANNLERINERLEALGENFRIVERKKIGRSVFFIASDLSPEHAPGSASPPVFQEGAGSPPPAPSLNLTEREKEILNALKGEEKEKVWKKLKVVKGKGSVGEKARNYGLSKSTVARWVKAYKERGIVGLIPWKKEAEEIPEEIKRKAESMFASSQMPIRIIHQRLEPFMAELGVYVSYDKLRNYLCEFFKNYKYEVTLRKYGRSEAVKYTPKIGRWKRENPFTVWQADHTKMDNWVVFSDGRVERPFFSAVVDEATGYILSWELLESLRAPSA